ncbi:ligand-binding sensor domain-containing protein [Polaribacter porphyrae]|uniref:HTH LytTR-type domain-containing protein n=1 Tax=Polaribacter porphyrae TaxID=1137780 RepID=A0A2S7WNH2_9FLAO|nr:LytTR family DNA-binding domain-containing protein [Polaribacter porphyrae]PQJ78821.1 hypothetical protein BTO18_06310 [Polaribacter porphyrae]
MQTSHAQTHIYQHFGVDEGLPSSEVYDIYQDKLGYIWFATDKGLSRYNGYEFENFTTEDGLPGNTFFDFYPQKNGQIWCYEYHSQKFLYFNEVFDGFTVYKYNDLLKSEINSHTVLKNVVINKNGSLLTGGYGLSGLITIDKNGNTKHLFDKNFYLTKSKYFSKLGFDLKTKTFFLLNYDYKLNSKYFFINNRYKPSSRIEVVPLNKTQSLFIDRKIGLINNQKLLKYYNTKPNPIGIKRINDSVFFAGYYTNGADIRHISGKIIKKFLSKKSVSNFLLDAEGGYWFSTLNDGVYYVKNPKIKVLTQDHISSLVKTNDNKLYAGFHNGDIARLHKNRFEFLYKGLNTDKAMVELNAVTNEVYGYADTNFINYTTKKTFDIESRKLSENIEDGIISTGGFIYNSLINNNVTEAEISKNAQDVCWYNNQLLLGTAFGLFTFKNDTISKFQPSKILSKRIDDIDLNKNTNTLYMATQGYGLVIYSDDIYNINKQNGLTNDIVSEVHIENDTTIWACTNTGLNRISFKKDKTYIITTITKDDGLLSNDIDDVEIINDTVWVATKKGLCYFKKDILEQKNASKIISLTLKKTTINSKTLTKKKAKLNYNQNNISFTLQAISHNNSNKINYLYRLKEIDTTWSKTTNRKIRFPSLAPRNYTFQAKAEIGNSISKQQINYTFVIKPPFWKSWWFYCLCTLLLCGLIYLFFKIRVLTYNKDIIRELMRVAIKRIKREEQFYNFRANGEDFKIPTKEIQYINSQGNYLDIITDKKNYTIRCKIGDFIATTPDALEYLRVHRSYIIRIEKVSSKGKNWVVIKDKKIPVGETYLNTLNRIQF